MSSVRDSNVLTRGGVDDERKAQMIADVTNMYCCAASSRMDYFGKAMKAVYLVELHTDTIMSAEIGLGKEESTIREGIEAMKKFVAGRMKEGSDGVNYILSGVSLRTFEEHARMGVSVYKSVLTRCRKGRLGKVPSIMETELLLRHSAEERMHKERFRNRVRVGTKECLTKEWLHVLEEALQVEPTVPLYASMAGGSIVSEGRDKRDVVHEGDVSRLGAEVVVAEGIPGVVVEGRGCLSTGVACFLPLVVEPVKLAHWSIMLTGRRRKRAGRGGSGSPSKGRGKKSSGKLRDETGGIHHVGTGEESRGRLLSGPPFNRALLWKWKVPVELIVERPIPNVRSSQLQTHSFLPQSEPELIAKIYRLPIESVSLTCFRDAHISMHGFVHKEEAVLIDKSGDVLGIPVIRVPVGRNYVGDDNYVQVVSGETTLFRELFPDVEMVINVPELLTKLREFGSGGKEIGSKRNNIRFDGGFTDHSPDVERPEGTIMVSRKLVNAEETYFYKTIGPIVVLIDRAVMKLGREGRVAPYSDPLRMLFTKELGNHCGLSRPEQIHSEAFSVCLTEVGMVSEENRDMCSDHLKNAAVRHVDGQNDERPGYNISSSLAFLVPENGVVYRLSIVAYCRRALGNIIEREYGFAQGIYEKCRDYHQKVGCYRTYMPSLKKESRLLLGIHHYEIAAMIELAFGDKCGYFSSSVCAIRRLVRKHSWSRAEGLQLFFCVLLCNGQVKFWYVAMRWLDKTRDRWDNLVIQYYRDCKKLGFGPQGGPYQRHCTHVGSWPGISEAELVSTDPNWTATTREEIDAEATARHCLEKNIAKLDTYLRMADLSLDMDSGDILDMIIKPQNEGGVVYMGGITSQAIFPLAAMIGLVSGKRRAGFGRIAPGSPVHKKLEEENHNITPQVLDSLLKGIAMKLDVTEAVGECLCCESHRGEAHYDMFFPGQELFGCWEDKTSGQVVVWQKDFVSTHWVHAEIIPGLC